MIALALSLVLSWSALSALPPLGVVPFLVTGTGGEEMSGAVETKLAGRWSVVSVEEAAAKRGDIWLEFRTGVLETYGGCNHKQFTALFDAGATLALMADPVPRRRNTCDAETMAYESRMNDALAFVTSAQIDENGDLILLSYKGVALRARRAP